MSKIAFREEIESGARQTETLAVCPPCAVAKTARGLLAPAFPGGHAVISNAMLNQAIVQSVTLRPASVRKVTPAVACVLASNNPDPTTIILKIEKPTAWIRNMERKRGIFNRGETRMSLFRNFKGLWTWDQDLTCDFLIMI